MSADRGLRFTEQEYLAFERASEEKHEFFDGTIVALAGTIINHARIVRNSAASLHNQQRGGSCETFTENIRLRIGKGRTYTYPDIMVLCGELQLFEAF